MDVDVVDTPTQQTEHSTLVDGLDDAQRAHTHCAA
jgi:hypothetical protein